MTYEPVNLVDVSLVTDEIGQKVGRLAIKNRKIYFEYERDFLLSHIEISPFKLPLKAGVFVCDDRVFEGLFGVFNDSLPDGWGRLLLDRQVRRCGIAPEQLTPLDRLVHVGEFGMGALCYRPDVSRQVAGGEELDLDHLADYASRVLEGEAEEVISELLDLSGSSAGARPKVMVGVDSSLKKVIHGRHILPEGYSHWMVKFPSSSDVRDIGAVEYAYSLMARSAGLEMMPTALFATKKGAGYFGVQRFDRLCVEHAGGASRLHVHTLSGLIHADHRLPSVDYETVLRTTAALTRNVKEVEKMFRLAVFNVTAHNRDDHAKNFGFLMARGVWTVAPAYDLTFSGGPGGEHSTSVMGEGKNPGKSHFIKLADKFSISRDKASQIIEEVSQAVSKWREFADKAAVSKRTMKSIADVISRQV